MNKIDYIKENYGSYYRTRGAEFGVLQGTKYAGAPTHCMAALNTLTRMVKPKNVLEIGSYHFHTTHAMAEAMDEIGISEDGIINTFDIRTGGYDGQVVSINNKRIKSHIWLPHHSHYDGDWKYNYADKKEFVSISNEDIYKKNLEYLKSVSPKEGYDLIFIDGDHSFIGCSYDWKYALEVAHKDTLIVFDNVWDSRLQEVRDFYNSLKTTKWDFEEWNDKNFPDEVQDTAISLIY